MGIRLPVWQKRYGVVALCFLATLICYIDRVNMSVAAIALQREFGWSDTTKGFVLSAFFLGYLLMQVPSGVLANRLGGKVVLCFAVVWWSAFTILTPLAASMSLAALIVARVALGLGEAATFPSIFSLYRHWVPPAERSRAVTFTLAGGHLGTLIALLLTGWVIETFGWPAAFYLFGAAGLAWAVAWQVSVTARPASARGIGEAERALLAPLEGDTRVGAAVPWRQLLGRPAVIALMLSHFAVNWVMYMLIAWMPSYFYATQGVSITGAAAYSAAPYLTAFVASIAGALLADRLLARGRTPTFVRKLMQCTGLLGAAAFLLLVREADTAPEALASMCAALGFLSMTFSGTAAATLEIAPRYADVVSGMSNTVATVPGIVAVVVTGWLVDMTGTYDAALALTAAVGVFGAVVWLVWGAAQDVLAPQASAAKVPVP